MKFRKKVLHRIETLYRRSPGNNREVSITIQELSGVLYIFAWDFEGANTMLKLNEEMAEELAVALTYALTSDDDTPTEGQ